MGKLDKYNPYFFDKLKESSKDEIGTKILGLLIENKDKLYLKSNEVVDKEEDITPDVYITSFKKEDIKCIGDIIPKNQEYEYKEEKGSYFGKCNFSVIENIVAALSLNGLWKSVQDKFSDKESIDKALRFKSDIPNELCYTTNILFDDGLKQYLDIYKGYGFKITELTNETILEKGFNSFTILTKLFKTMLSDIVLEEVVQAAENIVKSVDVLYKNLFNGSYIGLLLPKGQVLYSTPLKKTQYSKFVKEKETYLQGISKSWYDMTDIRRLSVNIPSKNMKEETYVFDENIELFSYDMFPAMHGNNLVSSQQKYNENKEKIKEDIKKYLTKKKEEGQDYSSFISQLERVFLSALFLIEGNQHTIQLRASLLNNVGFFEESIKSNLMDKTAGAEEIKILSNSIDDSVQSIQNITVIYSMSKFEQEVLFAHKLYEGPNAKAPSIDSPILGIKLDGTLFRKNLFGEKFTTILAGTRSGKGTLTQSLLAPLIASGQSIIYLDNKPDIASLFWDLEKKYREHGKDVHFLAIDSLEQSSTFIKNELSAAERGRVYDENGTLTNLSNVPSYCPIGYDTLRLLRTFKLLQLLFIAGEIAANNKSNLSNFTYYVFIDEITNLSERLYKLYSEISKIKEPKKGDSEGEAKYKWGKKVCSVINSVNTGFGKIKTMVSDMYNFKFIMIGQVFNQIEKWPGDKRRVNGTPGLDIGLYNEHFIYRGMSLCDRWLSGRLQVLSGDYVLHNDSEYEMAKKTGVFLYHEGKPNGPANLIGEQSPITDGTLFRSYFALVRNDIENSINEIKEAIQNGKAMEYLNSCQDVGYTNKFLYKRLENYGIDDLKNSLSELYDENISQAVNGVGFESLLEEIANLQNIDMFSDELIAKLNTPYDRLMYILKTAGIIDEQNYDCLESYLYDCSENSFYTEEEIKKRFWNGFNNNGVYKPVSEEMSDIDYSNLSQTVLTKMEELSKSGETDKKEIIDNNNLTEEEKKRALSEKEKEIEEEKERILKESLEEEIKATINKYSSLYYTNIAEITKQIRNLKSLSIDSKKEIEFNRTKGNMLDNFKGSYVQKKEKFFEKLEKDIENEAIRIKVKEYYKELYENTLETHRNEVENIRFGMTEDTPSEEGVCEKSGDSSHTPAERDRHNGVGEIEGQRFVSKISTGDIQLDTQNWDSSTNIKNINNIGSLIVKDIIYQFGGLRNISEITVTANECLAINGYTYIPQFDDSFYENMSPILAKEVKEGKIGQFCMLSCIIRDIMKNMFSFTIESPKLANWYLFKRGFGGRVEKSGYGYLFKMCPNLQTINLPNEELTRESHSMGNGESLGSKLANLFGFGRKNNDNYTPDPTPTSQDTYLANRIFDSRPLRILTGAFGWTMGCKAVVLAATLFGPWGLLFGGIAMAGAYSELKNNRGQQNNYGATQKDRQKYNGGYQQDKKNNSYNQQKGKSGKNNQQRR